MSVRRRIDWSIATSHMNRYQSAIECISRTQQFLSAILNSEQQATLDTGHYHSNGTISFLNQYIIFFCRPYATCSNMWNNNNMCWLRAATVFSVRYTFSFGEHWLGLNHAHDTEQPVAIVSIRRSYSPMTMVPIYRVGRTKREVSVWPQRTFCSAMESNELGLI